METAETWKWVMILQVGTSVSALSFFVLST